MSLPILAPNSSWFRPNNTDITRSIITEINIVDTYTVTGNEIDSWDASAANDGSVMCYVNGTKLTIAGNGSGKVFANEDSSYAFSDINKIRNPFTSLISIYDNYSLLDTSYATNFAYMFAKCESLISIENISNWDTSNVINMKVVFAHCYSLLSLNLSNWNVNNVTDMYAMFGNCHHLISLDLSKWNTSSVENIEVMFQNCTNLTSLDLSKWDTSSVNTLHGMFLNCNSLTSIGNVSNWDTSSVTAMNGMFSGCHSLKSLDLSKWYTSNVTTMHGMFQDCNSLTSLDISNWNISSVTNFTNMLYNTQPTIIGIEKLASIIPTLAPNSSWFAPNVSTITRSTITEIELVNSYTPTGNEADSWDASAAKDGRVMAYIEGTKLTIAGNGIGAIFANADSSNVFKGFGTLKAIVNGNIINTSNATTFEKMFQTCFDLESVDVSTWNTTNVTSLRAMFQGATSIGGLDVSNWNTDNVTDMYVFLNMPNGYINENLTSLDVSNWNTQNVENMAGLFQNCISLEELNMSNWIVDKVTTMQSMFAFCSSIKNIGDTRNWNTSLCEHMGSMFKGCTSLETLDVSDWNVSKVKSFNEIFAGIETPMVIQTLDISNWQTTSAEIMSWMFYKCNALTSLDLSGFDTSRVTTMQGMFNGMSKLERITLGTNFSFDGNGNITAPENMAVLPTPNAEHIPGADGKWHSLPDYVEYEPSAVPSKTADTYVAVVKATLAPNSTWFSQGGTDITRSSITEIEIVDSYTPTGNETASWDASALKDSSVMVYVNGTKLTIAGCGIGKIYANMDSSRVFSDSKSDFFSNLIQINGAQLLNTSNATTFLRMFDRCISLSSIDVSNWNTINVTNMERVFQACIALKTMDLSRWDVDNVTLMNSMFLSVDAYGPMALTSIGDVNNWKTGNVEDMSYMFQFCSNMPEVKISNWNVGNVKSMTGMFLYCNSLKTLDLSKWDVQNVETMRSMFSSTRSFGDMILASIGDVSNWNISKVKDMEAMFQRCSYLEELDLSNWNVSNVTNMKSMFLGCTNLKSVGDIGNWNTSSCENMNAIFDGCESLKTLNLSGFNTSNVTNMKDMFKYCINLEKITLGENFAWVGTDGYLPTPSASYVIDADGYWHTGDGSIYSSTSIPSNTANTYYAYPRANKNYIIDGVLLTDLSRTIREKTNTSTKLTPSDMNSVLAQLSFTKGVKF